VEKLIEKITSQKDPKELVTEQLISIIIGKSTSNMADSQTNQNLANYLRSRLCQNIRIEDLTKIEGITALQAFQILSAIELGRRFYKNNIARKLSNEDWDFSSLRQSERQYGVHFFHHYTAKFIPQIPAKLIRLLSKGNDIVVDPFMGSGTTLIEAKLLGCHSYGFDTNPLAVKIIKAKAMIINENKVKEIDKFLNWTDKERKYQNRKSEGIKQVELFENSHLWFRSDVAYKIKLILDESKNYSSEIQNFIQIGLSDLLKGMSNARMDSVEPILPENPIYNDKKHYYREVNNQTRNIPVFDRVYSQLKRMKHAILEFNKEADRRLICKPILADAREVSKHVKNCNLIITSPPYWSAQNYEKLHKLSFKLFNLKTEEGKEIGRNSSSYLHDMKIVFQEIAKVLNGYFAIVIGEDNKRKLHEKLYEIAQQIGFKPFEIIMRRISNQVSRAKQIKNEYIYVFKI